MNELGDTMVVSSVSLVDRLLRRLGLARVPARFGDFLAIAPQCVSESEPEWLISPDGHLRCSRSQTRVG